MALHLCSEECFPSLSIVKRQYLVCCQVTWVSLSYYVSQCMLSSVWKMILPEYVCFIFMLHWLKDLWFKMQLPRGKDNTSHHIWLLDTISCIMKLKFLMLLEWNKINVIVTHKHFTKFSILESKMLIKSSRIFRESSRYFFIQKGAFLHFVCFFSNHPLEEKQFLPLFWLLTFTFHTGSYWTCIEE